MGYPHLLRSAERAECIVSERLTSREAAEILGVGHSGIARTMKRNGIVRYEEPSGPNGLRVHVTYDGADVRALAAEYAARRCPICGRPVPQGNYITCNRPRCIEARALVVREAKNAAYRIQRKMGDGSARRVLEEPRADDEGRTRIIGAYMSHESVLHSERLMRTARECGCNVATVLSVIGMVRLAR